ncbi:methyltransferase domain-containing protein [Lichenifustis flavocetrariae]|uniref:Class I SAM-dependent methyltransferase n=1 Tax=Lichenifustis flavocetrariae TaxID=2949735 RepID=A0AA42CL20_9HYPH|nr:methyltransferase domain-containing protein [Lichenifustis flavocetrariae]MCW6509901.1 class I SAM-dependent methyltransferase [Lichenifustis flavocetrariae]
MALDVVDLRSFYAAPLGRLAHRFLAAVIRHWWPDTTGLAVLGCGFALPYLDLFRQEALRSLAFMPADQGVVHWPPHATQSLTSSALVDPDLLPLPDGSVDRVLLVHLLEVTEIPRDVLDEVWRVLAPSGRLIAVAPNRRGWWASVDTTPFGHGQPFSKGQLHRLLRDSLFSPERFSEILYIPPFERQTTLRMAPLFESFGRRLGLPGAGLLVAEATKQLYRPVMVRKVVRRSLPQLQPALAPLGLRRES